MEANKFVLVHQNSIGASFGLNALSGKKEKKEGFPNRPGRLHGAVSVKTRELYGVSCSLVQLS